MLDFQQEGVINEQCHTNSSTVQYGNCEHYWVAVAHILPTRVLCRPAWPIIKTRLAMQADTALKLHTVFLSDN